MESAELVPASAAALVARCSREALIRKIQTGEIAGRLVRGRWVVVSAALREYEAKLSAQEFARHNLPTMPC